MPNLIFGGGSFFIELVLVFFFRPSILLPLGLVPGRSGPRFYTCFFFGALKP